MNLIAEMRRRNVFRVAGVYAVIGWLLIQVIVAVKAPLHLPDWTDTFFVVLVLAGFPVAVILAWAFELTPEGVKLTKDVAEGESIITKSGRKIDYAILGGLTLVAAMIVADRLAPKSVAPEAKSDAAATAPVAAVDQVSDASIAVLPFADLSPAGDQQYFSQGIAEEILNVLANVAGLEVASRTSSFQFNGQEKIGVPVIAEQLHVRHILEGSVRKAGNTIRITAQLIDADTDKHLWSETYDRTLTTDNIFAVQDEITKAIVDQLSSRMGAATKIEAPTARAADTENADAYALYLEGQALFVQRGAANILRSIEALERAVEIDPGFARAWSVLSADYTIALGWLNGADVNRDFNALAVDAAKKALALDPSQSLAYAVLGNEAAVTRADYESALARFDEAIAHDPKNATAYLWRAQKLRDLGFFDRALADEEQCLAINPDYYLCRDDIAEIQFMQGQSDAAYKTLNENLRRGFSNFGRPGRLVDFTARGDVGAMLRDLNDFAFSLGDGDMRWAVDMMYQALVNPDYDRRAAFRVFEARLDEMGAPLAPRSSAESFACFVFGAYDRLHSFDDGWWWATATFPEWRASPERKRLMKELKLDVYWRKHGFPPQCKAVGPQTPEAGDFECE